jgi:hypothetical protein
LYVGKTNRQTDQGMKRQTDEHKEADRQTQKANREEIEVDRTVCHREGEKERRKDGQRKKETTTERETKRERKER